MISKQVTYLLGGRYDGGMLEYIPKSKRICVKEKHHIYTLQALCGEVAVYVDENIIQAPMLGMIHDIAQRYKCGQS